MKFLTDEKLLIVGAAGMIGSNMVQTAAMLGLTPNICLYDIYEPGLKGVLAEMKKVAWPTRKETYKYTLVVIVVCAAFAILCWLLDTIFLALLGLVV